MKLSSEFCFKQASNLAFFQALLFQGLYEFAHLSLSVSQLFGLRPATATGANEGSQSMPYFEYTFLLQVAIYLNHCVRVDYQSLGETANARKLIACRQCASFDGVSNLFLELNVYRNA